MLDGWIQSRVSGGQDDVPCRPERPFHQRPGRPIRIDDENMCHRDAAECLESRRLKQLPK